MISAVVIGAARRRQGIGAYVARSLFELDVEVRGIVGTSARTVAAARFDLARRFGIDCHGWTDPAAALDACAPDLVAICSPWEHHRAHLEAALAHGAHTLCEKPLWWGDAPDRAAVTERIARDFAARSLALELVTQWPCVLPAYHALWPETRGRVPRTFEMKLAPASTGRRAVIDAAPHAIALLQRLVGPGEVRDARAVPSVGGRTLDFEYLHAGGRIAARLRLLTCAEPPRPAGLGLDGHWAERTIDPSTYAMRLEEGERGVGLEDPLRARVAEFLENVASGRIADPRLLVAATSNLERLVGAR